MNIQEEIKKLKQELEIKYLYPKPINNNKLIYLRLSTIDDSKDTKEENISQTINQLRADFESLVKKYPEILETGFKLFIEVASAYKNKKRSVFVDLCDNYLFKDYTISELLEGVRKEKEKTLYIASFDRTSRVFFNSLLFQLIRKFANINIYTLLEEEVYFENNNKNVLDKGNLEQTLFVFQLALFSSSAERHSQDLSNKVKKRVLRTNKGTFSTKTGKRWGPKQTISEVMRKKIIIRFKKFTATEIVEQRDIYQVKKGQKEKISVNTIRRIINNKK